MNISFFIPAYNCEQTIADSVASILDGNFRQGDDIVILNDASTDRTPEVITKLAQHDGAIRVFHHDHNKGGGAARNSAIQHCRHSLLFCLDSDNILVPSSVPTLKDFLLSSRADVVSFGEIHYFKTDPAVITHRWRYRSGPITLADHLSGDVVPGASGNYLFTRESWARAAGYPEAAGALDTWGFAFRQLATGSKMLTLPDTHYLHRYSHVSYWVRDSKVNNVSVTAFKIISSFLDRFEPEDVEYILSEEGRYSWFENRKTHPIRVKGLPPGVPGEVISTPAEDLIGKLTSAAKSLLQKRRGGE